MLQKIALLSLSAVLLIFSGEQRLLADEPDFKIDSVVSNDLLAVGYLNLKAVDLEAWLSWAQKQGVIPADVTDELKMMTGMGQELLRQATTAGAEHALVLVHQRDLVPEQMPPLVFTVDKDHDADDTLKVLRRILGLLQIPDFQLQVAEGVIIGGTAEQVEAFQSQTKAPRDDVTRAWKKFSGHDAGLLVFGNRNTRRAVRELFPKLDEPFSAVTGQLIADKCESIGLTIELPADVDARIVVETADAESATLLSDALLAAKNMLLDRKGEFFAIAPKIGVAALSQLEPKVLGNDLVVDFKPVLNDRVKLMALAEPMLLGSRQSRRENQMRQIVLAMLNYESANGCWPARANFDADGRPLLSWRVHILPFAEHNDLYRRFNLDEPWDSENNIKLVNKMPDIYADPALNLRSLNLGGKTRFVVPVGKQTLFPGKEGVSFKEITDGSSNTISIVNVVPDKAVHWTKPGDWNVETEVLKSVLFNEKIKEAVYARGDGSVDTLRFDIKLDVLKALLTKAGGEVIP